MADHGIISKMAVNSPERGFLGCLAPSIERHPYQGRSQYIALFEAKSKEWFDNQAGIPELFIVTNVAIGTFEQIFLAAAESDDNCPAARWVAYDPALELLLVRMGTSFPHEFAEGAFETMLFEAVEATGLRRRQFDSFHTKRCQTSGGAKQADMAWIPVRMPAGRTRKWPSAVLEVAFSETWSKLQSDVRYWQRESAGEARIVFALRIGRAQQRETTVEQWVFENGHYRRRGLVNITQLKNGTTKVRGAPITVPFEELCLRAPETPKERNPIVLDEEKFEYLAERIWAAEDEHENEKTEGKN